MKRVLRALGLAVVFALALVIGVLVHLDVPVARRFVVQRVNGALASVLEGRIVIEQVDHVGLRGLSGAHARVEAPDGTVVLRADGVSARASAVAIARSALGGAGPLAIDLEDVAIDHVDLAVDADEDGQLLLARAFTPRSKAPSQPGGRGVRVRIARARVRTAWVHGRAGSLLVDADVRDLGGVVTVTPPTTIVDGSADVVTRAMPSGFDANGHVHAKVTIAPPAPIAVEGSFDGAVGGIALAAHAAIADDRLDARVDAPRVSAARLKALAPKLALAEDPSLHVEARGPFDELDVVADAALRDAKAHATATVSPTHVTIAASARDVDASAVAERAPETSLGLDAKAEVELANGAARATFTAKTLAGVADRARVPPADLHGEATWSRSAGLTVHAAGRVAEDGAPTDVDATLGPDSVVHATAHTTIPRLERVTRAPPKTFAGGSADAHARATIRLAEGTIDATVDGDVRDLQRDGQRIARAKVHARATGALASPLLDATIDAEDVAAGDQTLAHAHVTAQGTTKALHVEAQADESGEGAAEIRARADVDVKAATLRKAHAEIQRDHAVLRVHAETVRVSGGEIRVEDAVVEGVGAPARMSVRATPTEIVLRLKTKGLSLDRVARMLRLEKSVHGGHVEADVDLVIDKRGATGHVLGSIDHASIGGLSDVDAHADLTFDGRRATGGLDATIGDVAVLKITTRDLRFPADAPLSPAVLRRSWGRIDLDGRVDLARLYALAPPGSLPMKGLAGTLVVTGTTARDAQTDDTPEVKLSAKTEGLVVKDPDVAGLEVAMDLRVDGDTGAAALAARVLDLEGPLVTLDARSNDIPYEDLFAKNADVRTRLQTVAITGALAIPKRRLEKLPTVLALEEVQGEIEARLDFEGTIRAPRLRLTGAARRVSLSSVLSLPLDADLGGAYDGRAADVTLAVAGRSAKILDASAHIDAKVDDALDRGAAMPWTSSAKARLTSFPLSRIGALADRTVKGSASGTVTLDNLHGPKPRFALAIDVEKLQSAGIDYGKAKLAARVDDSTLHANARIEAPDGFADAEANAAVTWAFAVKPVLDPSRPVSARIRSRDFRAGGMLPFASALTQLDGRLDSNASVAIAPGSSKIDGTVLLSDGLFQLAATGTELHDAKAKLTLGSDGTIRLDDVSARGTTGSLTASATAHLADGKLADASATVRIPKGQALPIDLEGVRMGDVYGDLAITARPDPAKQLLAVKLDVKSLHVALPLAASHAVRELDAPSNVHVGVGIGGSFVALAKPTASSSASAGGAIDVTIHLGNDVEVSRGASLSVALEGSPVFHVADKTTATGQIQLRRGTLEVQGKKFEIEKGTVTFAGQDTTNPLVVVTAGWTAQDGTRVYADFSGPLKTGKVTLRSEPARPQSEILALIVFGAADGSESTPYGSQNTGAAAGGAAGGLATEGLTRGIDQLTGLDVATKIDTSTENPRPEVEVQIARSISLQIAFVLGTPPPGTNPDKTFATIDWRFLRQWSLQTTFGDQGSSLADVLWQYRY